MTFTLSRKPQLADDTIVRFHVHNSAGDIVGSISVPTAQANDLAKHWLGGTQAQASVAARLPTSGKTKEQTALAAAMVAAGKRPGAIAPPSARQADPMVGAMVAAASKHRLSREALLRGC